MASAKDTDQVDQRIRSVTLTALQGASAIDAAVACARCRIPVLPVHFIHGPLNSCSCADGSDCGTERAKNKTAQPGKHPITDLVPHGAKDATMDENTIREWWRRVPRANLGIVVGPKSGLFVIDVDVHDGIDGISELQKLEAEYGVLPETLRIETGGGGMHYIFLYPKQDGQFESSIAPGVQIRASDNTYIVAPPSVHRSGHSYVVEHDAEIAPAPSWVVERATRRGNDRSLLEVAEPGQRHGSITSLVGTMIYRDIPKETALEAALAYNRNQCRPPKPERIVQLTVEDLYQRYDTGPSMMQPVIPRPYVLRADGLYWVHAVKTGNVWQIVTTKLANFDVFIEKEVIVDDGAEKQLFFEIGGEIVGGRRLERVRVPVEDFAKMQWPYQWGIDAIIQPGHTTKDHLRTAIQERSSGMARREFIYQHTGWANIHDEWKYLHAGGAIDRNGLDTTVRVDLGGPLKYYDLPEPPTGNQLIADVQLVIRLMTDGRAPKELIYPSLGEVFRAPLAEACPVDFSDFLAGGTGTFKSAFQAAMQSFYGKKFTALALPANWSSTANSLERQTFLAKDAITVIDDFAPKGGPNDVNALHRKADQVLRGQGNRQGRGRLKRDWSLAPQYYPRGLICSSGEDVPKGPSLRGRMRISETKRDKINAEWLTEMQRAAAEGVFARFMAAFLQWLAPQMDELKRTLSAHQDALRDEFSKRLDGMGTHARTASILASVYLGFADMFMRFACDVGSIAAEEAAKRKEQCKTTLIKSVAPKQAEYLQTEDEVNRFIELLASALSSGHAYVADAHEDDVPPTCVDQSDLRHWGWKAQQTHGHYGELETTWRPQGKCVGWIGPRQQSKLASSSSEQMELYLDSQSAMAVVQTVAREQGSNVPITGPTLLKRLGERGLILRSEAKRQTTKVLIGSSRKRVVILDPATIVEPPEPEQATFGQLDFVEQESGA